MFDTHCHLNFSRFQKNVDEVIVDAHTNGITKIVIPGTDIPTSQKALEIAEKHQDIYVAIGIHPHHVYELKDPKISLDVNELIQQLEHLIAHPKVVAVGEIGMDRHVYQETKYEEYNIDEHFIELQKTLLSEQIKLAVRFNKNLILHNREAKADLLPIVDKEWSSSLKNHSVFHCCEPDLELLEFAKAHKMFIGVDGDITYYPEKQEFIKQIPLEMLVLETDSPFLLPEPMRTQKLFPNKPGNLKMIATFIANLRGISLEELETATTQNAQTLFQIS